MIVEGFIAIGVFAFVWFMLTVGTITIPFLYLLIAERTAQTRSLMSFLLSRKTIIKTALICAVIAILVTTSSMKDGRENIPTFSHQCAK